MSAGMLPPIICELTASTTEFKAKMAEARGEMAKTADEGGTSSSKLNGLGKGLAMGIGAAFAGVGVLAVEMGEKFQTSTASLAGHAGISMAAAQKMGQAFLGTAGTTTFSAQEMLGAIAPISGEIENLTGHTLTTSDSMKVLTGSMDLAEASGQPLAAVTKSLVDIMLPFHMGLSQSSSAANILWNTQRALGVTTTDLSSTYQRLVPRVAGSGMSLQQMSGFVVELSHSLGGGRQALRSAGTAIQGLVSPSSTANKALAAMGIQLFDSKGKFIGMGPAIEKMKAGLASLPGASQGVAAAQQIVALTTEQATLKGEAQTSSVKAQEKAIAAQLPTLKLQAAQFTKSSAMQAIFGRSANGMLAVIAGGKSTFDKYTKSVGKSGEVQSAAATNAATMHGQLKKMEATATDLVTSLGTMLIPVIQDLIGVVASATGFLMKHKDILIAVGAVIGTVVVAAIGSYIASQIAATVETVTNFVTMSAGAIAWAATQASSIASTIALWAMYATESIASFASSAAGAVASGATTVASMVASAASSTAAWIGSNALVLASTVASTAVRLGTWLAANAVMVASAVATGIAAAAAFLLPLAPFILIGAAVALLAYEVVEHFNAIKHFIVSVVGDVIGWIKSHWQLLLAILTGPFGLAVLFVKDHFNTIKKDASALIDDIVGFFTGMPAKIRTIWNEITADAGKVISGIVGFFTGLPHKIMNALKGLVGMFKSLGMSLVNAVVHAFSSIGSSIGGAIKGAVNSIPVIGGALSAIGLAKGGYVTKPTFALVGEAGPEFVIPAAQAKAQFAAGISPLSSAMPSATFSGASGGSSSPVGGGTTYAPTYQLHVQGDASPQTVALLKTMMEQHDQELIRELTAAR